MRFCERGGIEMNVYQNPRVKCLEYRPLEIHIAESRWQFCNCQSCQEKRFKLDSMPGPKIDYGTFRLKDERY